MAGVIVPLDVPGRDQAMEIVERLGEGCDFYKVGFELFTAAGPSVVTELRQREKRVFLDLKLHDIPSTVAGAVRAAARLGAELVTVHLVGGRSMLGAAREAAQEARSATDGSTVRLLGVTVLTSAGVQEIDEAWGRPIGSLREEVLRLAGLAADIGLDGVIASPVEAQAIRRARGGGLLIVTPGIRFAGEDRHDQRRVTTPGEAASAGADYLVVGRAITTADDPPAALRRCLREIEEATA